VLCLLSGVFRLHSERDSVCFPDAERTLSTEAVSIPKVLD
jgi:hypothetical protein